MILVFGATGLTGGLLLDELKAEKRAARAFVRPHHHGTTLNMLEYDTVTGDMADRDSLLKAMEGIRAVYLVSSIGAEAQGLQRNVIDVAREAGVDHLVRLSAVGANPKAKPRISRMHGELDAYLKDSGLNYTILCPHFFMQNLLPQRVTIAEDGDLYAPAGDGKIGFIDAEDIAATAAACLADDSHYGKTYTITGPEALTFGEVAEKIAAARDQRVEYVDISPDEFTGMMQQQGAPQWVADGVTELYGVFRAGYGDMVSSGVKRVLGREPHSFDHFAEHFTGSTEQWQ